MTNLKNFEELKSCCSQPGFLKEFIRRSEVSVRKDLWRLCERNKSIGEEIHNGGNVSNNSNRISVMMGVILEEELSLTFKHFNIEHIYADNNFCDYEFHKPYQLKTARDKIKADEKLAGSTSKTFSNNYTVQGATHCSSNCSNYIIIRYGLNINEKLGDVNCKIFKSLHFSILEDTVNKDYWQGKATSNNSRTTLRVPIIAIDEIKKGLVFGETRKAKKFIQFRVEEINF